MGFSRFPPRVRTAIVAAAATAILVVVYIDVLAISRNGGSNTTVTVAPTFIPDDRDLTGNPDAIIKKKDLEEAFGTKFRQYQESPVKAQGMQHRYIETNGSFAVSVFEAKGQEAMAAWQRLNTEFNCPDAPDIASHAKFQPDTIAAVQNGEAFVSVILSGAKPVTGGAVLTDDGNKPTNEFSPDTHVDEAATSRHA